MTTMSAGLPCGVAGTVAQRVEARGQVAQFLGDGLGDSRTERMLRRHEDCERERIVLGLGDQIGGEMPGIRARVGYDDHFGRAGERVDADLPGQLPLRLGDVGISRPDDRVAARDPLRAEREGRNRLRSPGAEDAGRPGDPGRSGNLGRNRSVLARRYVHRVPTMRSGRVAKKFRTHENSEAL